MDRFKKNKQKKLMFGNVLSAAKSLPHKMSTNPTKDSNEKRNQKEWQYF